MAEQKHHKTPLQILEEKDFVYVQAPMVRYSKLPFRLLCKRWGADILYTPMIVSQDFLRSPQARKFEFTSNKYDHPLVVQLAGSSAHDVATAATYLADYCDAIDINCGCPQQWAIDKGYGCGMLNDPERIKETVRLTKEMSGLPCSVKIRIQPDLKDTVNLVKQAESAGAAWITVHGRTVEQRGDTPVNYEAVKLVKDSVSVPVIGNGHCFNLQDAKIWKEKTGVDGVMAARGLLHNPALFAGHKITPKKCIEEFVDLSLSYGMRNDLFHQHLMFMLYSIHGKVEKSVFNNLRAVPSMLDYFQKRDYKFDEVSLTHEQIYRATWS